MFWSNDHMLCREVVKLNPFTAKKGSTQRSSISGSTSDGVATTLGLSSTNISQSGGKSIWYSSRWATERAKINYELKQELKMWKEQQGLEREKMWPLTGKRSLGYQCVRLNARHVNGWDTDWPHGMHGWDRTGEWLKNILAWMNGRKTFFNGCNCTDAWLKNIFARMRLHGWTAEENCLEQLKKIA